MAQLTGSETGTKTTLVVSRMEDSCGSGHPPAETIGIRLDLTGVWGLTCPGKETGGVITCPGGGAGDVGQPALEAEQAT